MSLVIWTPPGTVCKASKARYGQQEYRASTLANKSARISISMLLLTGLARQMIRIQSMERFGDNPTLGQVSASAENYSLQTLQDQYVVCAADILPMRQQQQHRRECPEHVSTFPRP
jgi:hypothetical protein